MQTRLSEAGRRHRGLPHKLICRLGYGQLRFDEYDWYRTPTSRFAGRRTQAWLDALLNHGSHSYLASDKYVLELYARALGLPVVRTLFLHEAKRPGATDRLSDWLRREAKFPLFCKPRFSSRGRGALLVAGHEKCTQVLRTSPGPRPLAEVAPWAESDYLLQQVLRPHPDLVDCFGERLTGLRMVVLDGRIVRVVQKIPVGSNVVDNWGNGNLVAAVDLGSGVTGEAYDDNGLLAERHPDTGQPIANTPVPLYRAACEMIERAAVGIPHLVFQHWDVALSDEGPVIVELNTNGNLPLVQYAHDVGIMTDFLFEVLERRAPGWRRRLVWSIVRGVMRGVCRLR